MTRAEYEEKKAELERQLEELEKETIVEKRWKPSQIERYLCVSEFGTINHNIYTDDIYDEWLFFTGNCFKTEEEAKEHKKKLETYYEFKNYIEEHNDEIDWKDDRFKWFMYYNYEDKIIAFDWDTITRNQGTIYATSKQILEDAVNYVGEENVKKYIFEVE